MPASASSEAVRRVADEEDGAGKPASEQTAEDQPSSSTTTTPRAVRKKSSKRGERKGSAKKSSSSKSEEVSYLPEKEEYQLELNKDDKGLGITVAGYVCEKGESAFLFLFSKN